MRVRAHVHAAWDPRGEIDWSHMIKEDERADHAPLAKRQQTSDLEAAEVAFALVDRDFQHGQAPRYQYRSGQSSCLTSSAAVSYATAASNAKAMPTVSGDRRRRA